MVRKQIDYDRIYHFVIICHPRSGSHLLASFLDSHPGIECDGEIGQKTDGLRKLEPDDLKLRGGIVMDGRLGRLSSIQPVPRQFIHLVRDPKSNARSELLNAATGKAIGKKHHRAHRFDGEEPIIPTAPEPDLETILHRVHDIRVLHDRIRQWLDVQAVPRLTITYEELSSNGQNVARCPRAAAQLLCGFLGVRYHDLFTNYRKGQDKA